MEFNPEIEVRSCNLTITSFPIMSRPEKIQAEQALAIKQDLGNVTLTHKNFILYALGIGFSTDPYKQSDFKYTYQYDENFSSFPTYASCLGQEQSMINILSNPHIPKFQLHTILHGQQKLYMVHKRLQNGATYRMKSELIDIIDKGNKKGAVLVNRINGYLVNQKGEESLAYYVDRSVFAKSLGGSGFKGTGKSTNLPSTPKRNPDVVLKDKTFINQALIYRLNSDPNPLHVDPNIAALAKFERPIIHGLATYGTVARSIVQNLLNNDNEKLKSIESRFTGHVFPGENLEIKVWKEQDKLFFEAEVVERKTKAIVGVITVRESAKL